MAIIVSLYSIVLIAGIYQEASNRNAAKLGE